MRRVQLSPEEERAREILSAFRRLERQERARLRISTLLWVLEVVLLVALGAVVIAQLPKLRLFQQLLTRPDSLLLHQPGSDSPY